MIWIVLYVLGIPIFTFWFCISILYAKAKNIEIKNGMKFDSYKFKEKTKTKFVISLFIFAWPIFVAYSLIKIPILVVFKILTEEKKEK